jgi:hypothetical protein
MKQNILLSAVVGLFLLTACEKEEVPVFDRDETGIYFLHGGVATQGLGTVVWHSYSDSASYSFSAADLDMSAITTEYINYILYGTPMTPIDNSGLQAKDVLTSINIQAMGKMKDYDRPVKISIDEGTTAIRNVHYEVDLDNVVIPAGKGNTSLNVRLIRTPDLLEQAFTVKFKLEENEHFKLYLQTQRSTDVYTRAGREIEATRFSITFSEIYTEPGYWSSFCRTNYFGPWTARKYAFVNETMGWSSTDWVLAGFPISKVALGRFAYAAIVVRSALQKLADEGTPLRETNGSLVQLIGIYLVDYSAYE